MHYSVTTCLIAGPQYGKNQTAIQKAIEALKKNEIVHLISFLLYNIATIVVCIFVLDVLLKALPPVCMKYTA